MRDWVFNSSKVMGHPILKKKKENMVAIAVIKMLCGKNGYGKEVQECSRIRDIREVIEQIAKGQKGCNTIKVKKVVRVLGVTNEPQALSLL
jgi:hypothetical protein